MQLTSKRLTLSTLKPEDWQFFLRVHSDEMSMHFISDIPPLTDIRERFQTRLVPWQITSFHMLCLVIRLKESRESVGLIGANAEWLPFRQVEVGYILLSTQFGQGYGSEALGTLSQYLFDHCEFHKLKAQVAEGNPGSRRVLEKNGFELEGTLRHNSLLHGHWVNDWVFGRINPRG